MYTQFIMFKIG